MSDQPRSEDGREFVDGDAAGVDAADAELGATDAELDDPAADGAGSPPGTGGAGDTPGHVDEVIPPTPTLEPGEELEELRDRHLRLAAEFDNYRRRTRRELLETGETSRAGLARKLLEIVDDLQRVADSPCDPEAHEAMHEGVGLIARKLLKTLSDEGVESLDPLGERFDPNFHEAVLLAPTEDPAEDELVSQVLLTGYRLGDRLLRPAQVVVYRHEEGDEGGA